MQRYGLERRVCTTHEQSAVEIRDVVRWQDRGFVTLKRPNVLVALERWRKPSVCWRLLETSRICSCHWEN